MNCFHPLLLIILLSSLHPFSIHHIRVLNQVVYSNSFLLILEMNLLSFYHYIILMIMPMIYILTPFLMLFHNAVIIAHSLGELLTVWSMFDLCVIFHALSHFFVFLPHLLQMMIKVVLLHCHPGEVIYFGFLLNFLCTSCPFFKFLP